MCPFNTLYNGLYHDLSDQEKDDLIGIVTTYDGPSLVVHNRDKGITNEAQILAY